MNIREEFASVLSDEYGAMNVKTETLDKLMVLLNGALCEAENKRGASKLALEIASKLPQNDNEVLESAIKYRKFLLDIS